MGFLDGLVKPNVAKLEAKRDVEGLLEALRHKDPGIRQDAALALGRIGDARAVDPLAYRLWDVDRDVKRAAAEAMAAIGDVRAVDALITALAHATEPRVSLVAAEALVQIGRPAVESLIVALRDSHYENRPDAARVLGQIGDARALEALTAALQDGDYIVRRAAAEALDGMGWRPRKDETSARYWVAKQEWKRCAAIGGPAVGPLIAELRPDNVTERLVVEEALVRIGAPAVEPLISALKDSKSWQVRRDAVEALGEIGDPRAVEPLIAALTDLDSGVLGIAAEALGRIGDARAVGPLSAMLKDADLWEDRRAAARALGTIGDVRAVGPLSTALKDRVPAIREAAAEALRMLGTPGVEALAASRERSAASPGLSESEMLRVLSDLCDAYAANDRAAIVRLEPQATAIGEALDERGGYHEMLRVFEKLGDRRGSRTLEMHWGGIGDWQG
jgi:HEAT repeat protein